MHAVYNLNCCNYMQNIWLCKAHCNALCILQIIYMLILVLVIFFITWTPTIILHVVHSFCGGPHYQILSMKLEGYHLSANYLHNIVNLVAIGNGAVNPFVYAFYSGRNHLSINSIIFKPLSIPFSPKVPKLEHYMSMAILNLHSAWMSYNILPLW